MGISRDHQHKRRATGGKRKPIRKKRKFELVALLLTLSLDHSVSTLSVCVVETGNTVLSVWTKAISPGDLNVAPARPASLISSTMHQTTSWSAPRLWSRMLLWLLMLPPSDSGMKATMPCP